MKRLERVEKANFCKNFGGLVIRLVNLGVGDAVAMSWKGGVLERFEGESIDDFERRAGLVLTSIAEQGSRIIVQTHY